MMGNAHPIRRLGLVTNTVALWQLLGMTSVVVSDGRWLQIDVKCLKS